MINSKSPNYPTTQTAILGTGPAGIAAAIQLKRYGLAPILLEKDHIGGLLRNANFVENYPGFPHGIPGPKLVALFEKQMQRLGLEVTYDEVTSLDFDGTRFLVQTKCNSYSASRIILATGTKPRPFPIEIPAQAKERVFSEVWPLRNVRGKQIFIVGAGDAAFDFSLNLANRGNTITILNRGTEVSCLPLLRERVEATPNINYREQTNIQKIETDAPTSRLRLLTNDCTLKTENCLLLTDYLLFAIGRQPAMDFLTERVKLQGQTLQEDGKLYLVGDVHNGLYRQTAIAVGEGLRAAMHVYEQLSLRGS